MPDDVADPGFRLHACRELLEVHPQSLHIREQVEAIEEAIPDRPGVVVSFCKAIIETTCKTILTDRGAAFDGAWDTPKLVSESMKFLNLSSNQSGVSDTKLRTSTESLARGLSQIVQGVVGIRNSYGSAAHGADAYAPLLDTGYAEILARATDAIIGLLFRTHLRSAQHDPLARFRYGDHPDFDDFIDTNYGPFEVLEIPLTASDALFHTDFEAYRAELVQFRQEARADSDDGRAEGEA